MVGTPITLSDCAVDGLSSISSSYAAREPDRSSATFSRVGASARHGPHHEADNFKMVKPEDLITLFAFLSVAVFTNILSPLF
jgi:hypothetical protein